ncbi:Dynamin-like protein, mitochondrial [Portunus trituberculatus]|uniref:Dynamin-like protein, mitochondrial n=1 Tax=Portunus trituberculatus TaxID=210409 RepID=A0A5B7DKS1_PORTR|nr:Dynamin-like protein, mitochondrial [Portunus trituberculatus]
MIKEVTQTFPSPHFSLPPSDPWCWCCLCRGGVINSHQCTTRNLSFAVSERFWKMVRDTVEQQADAFKATRFNLETEWKNNFPRTRELDRDELFEKARGDILDEVVNLSQVSPKQWEEAADVLRVIQLNALEDRSVSDKQQWDAACRFLEESVKEKLTATESTLREMVGPGTWEQWLYWTYPSEDQKRRATVRAELEKLLATDYNHKNTLTYDEVTAVRKNTQSCGVEVDNEFIREMWHPVYRRHFLRRALAKAYDCRKAFYAYHQGLEGELGVSTGDGRVPERDGGMRKEWNGDGRVECNDVVLFWRIQQMFKITANALRQQVMNREGGCGPGHCTNLRNSNAMLSNPLHIINM